MVRNNLLSAVFYLAILVALLHSLAVFFFLYSYYWWFDIPLHFLGGLMVGLFSLWLFSVVRKGSSSAVSSLQVLCIAFSGALIVGLAWELFEYSMGFTFNAIGNYKLDVIKDLTMDIVGGLIAYMYFLVFDYHS